MLKKAQVFTFDVFLSLMFFVSVFAIWLLITNQLVEQASYAYEINMLDKKLQRASDLLIRSRGVPEDWNGLNVKAFGLVNDTEYVVSFDKILNFFDLTEEKIRSVLGLGGYNIYFKVTNITGGDFPEGRLEKGSYPSSDARVIVSIKRYFIIQLRRAWIPNSTFYLDRLLFSPNSNLPLNFSAFGAFPTGKYTNTTIFAGGDPIYFYQNPPLDADFNLPDPTPASYKLNFSIWLENPTNEKARINYILQYYDENGNLNDIQAVNAKQLILNPGETKFPYSDEWSVPQPIFVPKGGGFVFIMWVDLNPTYKGNVTIYFDGYERSSHFRVPGFFPPPPPPRENELAVMQFIVWR
ncbi:MAG: hypothetical protein ACP5O8_02195 [Candidatus Aenigmatarchaeota archaeon]